MHSWCQVEMNFIYSSFIQIEFPTMRQERFVMNCFFSPINEHCSKIFLNSLKKEYEVQLYV